MSKDKRKVVQLPNMTEDTTPEQETPLITPPVVQMPLKLMEADRLALELAKQRKQTVLAEAKTALAQAENAELAFKYVVLQLYMKYGLTDADAISENGDIIKGGALAPPVPKT